MSQSPENVPSIEQVISLALECEAKLARVPMLGERISFAPDQLVHFARTLLVKHDQPRWEKREEAPDEPAVLSERMQLLAAMPKFHTDMRYHGEFVRGWNSCLQDCYEALGAPSADSKRAMLASSPTPPAGGGQEPVGKPEFPGATVADRLDAMADESMPGSQSASDLYAAATIWRKHLAHPAPQAAQPAASVEPFGLDSAQLEALKSMGLKPEEIAGTPKVQAERVRELLHWFARLAKGSANPKWAVSHAYELAYYVATTDDRAPLDLSALRKEAWLEGVQISDADRAMCVRIGLIPAPVAGQDDGTLSARNSLESRAIAQNSVAPQPAQDERSEDAYVIDRMSKILAEIALIVRGPEQARHRHGYADLPARVAALSTPPMEGDALDAKRYRWLRRAGAITDFSTASMSWKQTIQLDVHIDAAIAAMGGEK